MFKNLLIAGAFACLSFGAFAAECQHPFDATVGEFSAAGANPVIIPDDKLAEFVDRVEDMNGVHLGEVSRGFMVVAGGKLLLGLEVDGCLIPPIVLGLVSAPKAPKLSGKNEAGEIGA